MSYRIQRDDSEIDDVLNDCDDQEEQGGSRYPGMTYEQGVAQAIRWLTGDWDHPTNPE